LRYVLKLFAGRSEEDFVMTGTIRLATENDAAATRAIYVPIVKQTSFSFELTPPNVSDMRQRLVKTLERLPWLVCEYGGVVVGYTYANPHRVRAAYQWSVEVSVYVHAEYRQKRVARALYTSLFALLRLQGYYNVYAGITLPNDGGVRLHESLGFQSVGVYEAVAYKLGAWQDVSWWQMMLQDRPGAPKPPTILPAAQALPEWEDALNAGVEYLR
jgi:L-amino acid N-acyltransferase YncA